MVFIDPEHPKLSAPHVEWGEPIYAAYVEFGGAAGGGKRTGTNNRVVETLFGYPVFYQR